ncbi:glycosyltransferase [Bacteroides sp. GM023]|uniref:glycosyltransferase n=1 Tax=Bacteroides sp. GM023 TaxID=2723058 RepID=UPI00168ABC6D|nr:glycosyltransferase [Bacteroides sp. GM023]MBD3588349.1 glycosyltransferase [Bacteroides sp. GM023]
MTPAPILLFVYNRPEHVRQCIASLQANELAAQSPLFIYSDAAKTPESREGVEQTRRFIRDIDGFASVTIIEREQNWGLARSIIDGVTTQVNHFGRVIVMEDDLIAAPFFLQFMNDTLETYKDEPRVGHIQGCDFTQDTSLPDTFLIKWTGSWGWGTWDRAWKLFNPNGKELLQQLEERNLTHRFDFNSTYGYTRMLRRQIEGKNNSWAIRWNASLFLADILSLNAGRSLIRNTGFDGSGTNCGGGGLYDSTLWLNPLPVKKLSPIEENEKAREAFVRYYHRTNCFMAKAIRRIKRTLKGDFGA